jgi:hypothetical protein
MSHTAENQTTDLAAFARRQRPLRSYAGQHRQSSIDAASLIHTLEARQGMRIACLEKAASRKGFLIARGEK